MRDGMVSRAGGGSWRVGARRRDRFPCPYREFHPGLRRREMAGRARWPQWWSSPRAPWVGSGGELRDFHPRELGAWLEVPLRDYAGGGRRDAGRSAGAASFPWNLASETTTPERLRSGVRRQPCCCIIWTRRVHLGAGIDPAVPRRVGIQSVAIAEGFLLHLQRGRVPASAVRRGRSDRLERLGSAGCHSPAPCRMTRPAVQSRPRCHDPRQRHAPQRKDGAFLRRSEVLTAKTKPSPASFRPRDRERPAKTPDAKRGLALYNGFARLGNGAGQRHLRNIG